MPEFERAFGALRAALSAHGLDRASSFRVELVFEEIVSNILRHGTMTGGAVPEVDLAIEMGVGSILMTFLDSGPPFDPIGRADPAKPAGLDDAPVGGRGLKMVRDAAIQMYYERTAEQINRLTVTLPSAPDHSAA